MTTHGGSVKFLLCWRRITGEGNNEWVTNYLKLFNVYVQSGVVFDDLSALEFCTINLEKTSRTKVTFKLPPYLAMDESDDVPEVIMVLWKKQERNWAEEV